MLLITPIPTLSLGVRNRTTRAHELNEYSSRSHSMMTIHIDIEGPDPYGGKPVRKHGKISFVDLAGKKRSAASNLDVDLSEFVR